MYVIIVPVIEWVFPCLQGKMTILAWVAALSSVLGLYLLSGCAEESCIDTNLGIYVCMYLKNNEILFYFYFSF